MPLYTLLSLAHSHTYLGKSGSARPLQRNVIALFWLLIFLNSAGWTLHTERELQNVALVKFTLSQLNDNGGRRRHLRKRSSSLGLGLGKNCTLWFAARAPTGEPHCVKLERWIEVFLIKPGQRTRHSTQSARKIRPGSGVIYGLLDKTFLRAVHSEKLCFCCFVVKYTSRCARMLRKCHFSEDF